MEISSIAYPAFISFINLSFKERVVIPTLNSFVLLYDICTLYKIVGLSKYFFLKFLPVISIAHCGQPLSLLCH